LNSRRSEPSLGGWAVAALAAVGLSFGCSDGSGGAPSAPDAWTMLGYDLSSSYTNRGETAISTENAHELGPLWEFEARGLVYGTPVVVDGVVYITSTGGLYAFDDASGALLWQNLEFGATSSLAYSDGTIFVHDLGAFLRALDAATGEQKWQTRTDTHPLATGLSSPIVFERYVVVGLSSNEIVREGATFRGGVAAFDRETGEQLWRDYTADPPNNGASVWSTVSIDAEARVVFAGSGQNYTEVAGPKSDAIFALDLDTGARLWTTQTVMGDVFTPINPHGPDADFGANPILVDAEIDGRMRRLVAAGQKNGMFWALDRETGDVVWERTLGRGSPLTGGVLNNGAFDGERILVANNDQGLGYGTLFALRPGDGEILWERPLSGWVWAPITVANGVGFVAADKNLYGFDVATGADLFVFATQGTIACGASVAAGRVRVGSGIQHIVGTVDRKFHVLGLPGDAGGMGPRPVATPSGAPTFTAVYEEILIGEGCNTPLCHGGGAGNLPLRTKDEAYQQLVGIPAAGELCANAGPRVDPGNAAGSILWAKVATRDPPCGDPMPISAAIPAEQVEQIRRWIERGAPND
jgi:polyvinyl alcohol dehydrogenase (cytochrome)